MSPTPHAAALALGPTFAGARAPARSTAIDVGAGHLPALDGLRGLAVLAVIAFHLCAVPIASGAAWRLAGGVASVGWLGVELFFVLSGCLITGILLDTRDGARPLATFWARRALRIAPLYFALLAVAFVLIPTLVPALRQSHPRFLDAAPWYATFLTNVALARSHGMAAFGTGHLWSLAIEEQFYLVWPLVVLRATPRALARVTLALFGLGVLARAALRLTGVTDAYETYVLTPTHLDGLLAGALLALALRHAAWRARLARHALRGAAAAAALVGLVMLAQRSASSHALPMQVVGYPLVAVAMAGVVARAALARRDGGDPWARALGRGPLAHAGTHSYALYLLHYPVMTAVGVLGYAPPGLVRAGLTPGAAQLAACVLVVAITYVLARASWLAIERPALRLKAWVPYVRAAAGARATPARAWPPLRILRPDR